MKNVQVLIIGAGASGMAAAIAARRCGADVLVLEKNSYPGKKLLATGNGKCNFTNRMQKKECYRSSQPDYPWQVIQKYGYQESIGWFGEMGILAKEKEGYVYPASGQASSVRNVLAREMERLGAQLHTEEAAEGVQLSGQKGRAGFLVVTGKAKYLAKKVILSTGGMASPAHGSTGDGYAFARGLGHHIVQPVPALTSLVLEGNFMKQWSGVRTYGKVSLYSEKGSLLAEDTGEIQMVSYGISGIPVFQISRFAAEEIARGRRVRLFLDSMPEYARDWLQDEIFRRRGRDGAQTLRSMLEGMLPDKLASVYIKWAGLKDAMVAGQAPEKKLILLASLIKKAELPVQSAYGFEKAQVTAGGVCTEEVSPDTMESLLCKNLYITGELLDVDGICGGYNLQWAWATGCLAGKSAAGLPK